MRQAGHRAWYGHADNLNRAWQWALGWEHWWAEGWVGPHVPPWIARTFPG